MKKIQHLNQIKQTLMISVLSFTIWSLALNVQAQITTLPNPTSVVGYENTTTTFTFNAVSVSGDYIWSFAADPFLPTYFPSFISEVVPSGTGTYQIEASPVTGDEGVYFFNLRVVDDVNNNGTEDSGEAFSEVSVELTVTRKPVKIVFVLDKSGSMGWIANGGTDTRWNILKPAVEAFVDKMEIFKASDIGNSLDDKIGLSYFSSSVTQPNPPIDNGFISITVPTAAPSSKSIIMGDINLKSPGGSTAMGSGLLDAKAKLATTSIDTTRVVLLFTDGEQNVSPQVDASGTTLDGGTIQLNDGPGSSPGSIKFYTIGIGGAGTLPAELNAIATNNRGVALTTTSNTVANIENDFNLFFTSQFANIFKEYSPQLLDYRYGTISGGGSSVEEFKLNKQIKTLIVQVTNKNKLGVDLSVEKDGTTLTPYVGNVLKNNFYSFYYVHFPYEQDTTLKPEGDWTVTISSQSTDSYDFAVFADDHNLDYSCEFDKNKYTVGDQINFNVTLEYLRQPLTGTKHEVKVFVLYPGDDLGNSLATTQTDPHKAADDISQVQQKYLDLMEDEDFFESLLPKEQIISLTNNGDGTHSGTFVNEKNVSGVIRAIFKMNGELPGGDGIYERMEIQTTVFEFGNIDVETTEADQTIADNVLNLTVRPKNVYGYYIGPGYSSRINVTVDGSVITNPADNLNGSYTYKVPGVSNGENPSIKISVMDEVYYEGSLSKFPPKKVNPWLLIIIIVLVVFAILQALVKEGVLNKIPKWIVYLLIVISVILYILRYLGIISF